MVVEQSSQVSVLPVLLLLLSGPLEPATITPAAAAAAAPAAAPANKRLVVGGTRLAVAVAVGAAVDGRWVTSGKARDTGAPAGRTTDGDRDGVFRLADCGIRKSLI